MEIELRTLTAILPELSLVVAAVTVMVGGTFWPSKAGWAAVSLASVLGASALLYGLAGPPLAITSPFATGPLSIDTLANTMRHMALGFGGLFVLMLARPARRSTGAELLGKLLLVTAGTMLVASAADFVTIFVALELVSIPTYVLLFLGRADRSSAEATAKYFFLSILSSGGLLMGLALIYGLTGATNFADIQAVIGGLDRGEAFYRPALLAMVLVVSAIGFKLAVVPFHFYAPDVYLATTHWNAGILAVFPKMAGLVALSRLMWLLAPLFPEFGWQLMVVLSILTMTVGTVGALLQKNVRRLMAFSSIAHAGYILIGVAVGLYGNVPSQSYGGFPAAFLYLLFYGVASIGTFAALSEVQGDDEVGSVSSLAGLARRRPWMAGAIAVCMFSMAGLPPFAGFWSKLAVLSAALSVYRASPASGLFLAVAVVGILNAAIGATYYLRVVGTMYFYPSSHESRSPVGLGGLAAAICSLFIVWKGLTPGSTVDHFQHIVPFEDNPNAGAIVIGKEDESPWGRVIRPAGFNSSIAQLAE